MIKLGLIRETQSQKLMIQPRTTEVLEDEVKFGELITRRIMSILEDAGVPYGDIRTAANEIQLPEVRDPATILRKLQTNGNASEITDREFSRLLFLLACAGQRAERHIRTFYEFR